MRKTGTYLIEWRTKAAFVCYPLQLLQGQTFVIARGCGYIRGQRLDTSHIVKRPTHGWSVHDDLEASHSCDSDALFFLRLKVNLKGYFLRKRLGSTCHHLSVVSKLFKLLIEIVWLYSLLRRPINNTLSPFLLPQ